MKAICSKCGLLWDVSVHKNLRVPFVCPHCYSKSKAKKVVMLIAGFVFSFILVPVAAGYANSQRGYEADGGEILIPILYIAVVGMVKAVTDIKKENAHN